MHEERIGDTIGDMAERTKAAVERGFEGVAEQARLGAMRAGAALQEAVREAGREVNDAAASLYRQGGRAGGYLRHRARARPVAALLVAGAVGFMLAMAIRRR
jgi:hypothetical protein